MSGPLAGIRILDLTTMASGPLATAILGDQGADVIKIEPPGRGDLLRHIGCSRGGLSAVFANMNRSKRSLVLNLTDPRGVDLLDRLAATADVFVQNFRPGVAERMGIGPDRLRARYPRLVYVSISGFGREGPDAGRRVYDSVMQAYAGFAAHQADPETDEPAFVQNVVCDKATALTTAQTITAALYARERGTDGQHLEISMLHASIAFLWPDGLQNHSFLPSEAAGALPSEAAGALESEAAGALEGEAASASGSEAASASSDEGMSAMRRATLPAIRRTRDGYVAISTVGDAEFRGLCRALGCPELQADPRFAEAGARAHNADALHALVVPRVAALTTDELVQRLTAEDVPHAPVTPLAQLHEHPQVVANSLLREDRHPLAGRMRGPEPVGRFEKTPLAVERLAPGLGEHTDLVLGEIGVAPEEIARLREAGVVA